MRRLVAGLLAVLLPVLGTVALATPASASTVAPDAEGDLLARHAQARAGAGVAAVVADPGLQGVARSWAQRMADEGNLRHNPDLVGQVDGRVTNQWTRLGENVGRGTDVGALHDAFMASPGHRSNILGDFNRVGVGVARDGGGQLWVAVIFLKGPPLAAAPPPPPPPAPAPAASWQPFDSPDAFAAQQYQDFLGRPGDAAGIRYWADALRSARVASPGVAESFLHSPEFEEVVAPVVRLFLADAPGPPPSDALRRALDDRRAGASLDDVARDLAGSRARDLMAAASTPEFRWNTVSEVLVTMAYVGMLRRAPEASGFSYWLGHLDAGRPLTTLLAGILASPEYAARF